MPTPSGGQRPDYDGQSGRINFDSHGDITPANYMVYTYGEDNLATVSGTETASSAGGLIARSVLGPRGGRFGPGTACTLPGGVLIIDLALLAY